MKRSVKNINLTGNAYLLFLPFLLIYVSIVLIFHSDPFWGDEGFYFFFAKNLTHGYYSPPPPNITLHYGPGYPIILTPFVALQIPFLFIKLLNPVFFYLSIVFLYKSLMRYTSPKIAITFSMFWALYYNAWYFFYRMHSEIFATFLIATLVLLILKVFDKDKPIKGNKYIYLAGFVIGYIALTKVIFGYVLLVMLTVTAILWLFNRKAGNYRTTMFILVVAFVTTLPYLTYTYRLTGRLFCWGTTAGNNLYWLTNPTIGEYGNWLPDPRPEQISTQNHGDTNNAKKPSLGLRNISIFIPGAEDSLNLHHKKDYEEINKYKGLARDDAFKKIAIKNIIAYPDIFIRNCFCNMERILFNYPNAYMLQKPGNLSKFPMNGIIVVFILICLPASLMNWRKIIFPARFLLFFAIVYLGGSVLGSAESRMFTVVAPIIIFWIAYIIHKTVRFRLSFEEKEQPGKTEEI
jgi:hypothetical protein